MSDELHLGEFALADFGSQCPCLSLSDFAVYDQYLVAFLVDFDSDKFVDAGLEQ